jgi:hypothetical protein
MEELTPAQVMHVKVGSSYQLSQNKALGDYAGDTVYVETGPRGSGPSEQYRVSFGTGMYDVDWIDTWMFNNAREVASK